MQTLSKDTLVPVTKILFNGLLNCYTIVFIISAFGGLCYISSRSLKYSGSYFPIHQMKGTEIAGVTCLSSVLYH